MATSVAGRSELHEFTGSYSVDALEAADQTAFEAHLATCDPCRDEVVRFRETAAELSVLSMATPPPRLCVEVLAAARTTPRNPARDEGVNRPSPGR